MSEPKKISIEEIQKNNELFANSLTFQIVWEEDFIYILQKSGFDRNYIVKYTWIIKKYIYDYTQEIKNHLYNLKKSI